MGRMGNMGLLKRIVDFLRVGKIDNDLVKEPDRSMPRSPAPQVPPSASQFSLWEHTSNFAGLGVKVFDPTRSLADQCSGDVGTYAWRVGAPHCAYDEGLPTVSESLTHIASDADADAVTAIVIGAWASWEGDESSDSITQLLVASHDRLKSLKHLFFADILGEESEISWIEHTNVAPILAAFPNLETLVLRGAGITFGRAGHEGLRELLVQSGGMLPDGVRDISESEWPRLERLTLWLGTSEYGGGAGPDELAHLLEGRGIPRVRHLGLMNSDRQDEIVGALVTSPVVNQLKTVDLSMGTLSDKGAEALVENAETLRRLERIDVRWNFIHDELATELEKQLNIHGVRERADDADEGDEWRFVEVSE
jgi:hypothetical protein